MGILDFFGIESGRKLAELADILGYKRKEDRLLKMRPAYTPFVIPKRRGGTRTIHAPSPDLKALQRTILHKVLIGMPIHPAATAYTRGRSIVDNARPHVGAAIVLTLDLEDFFGATGAEVVRGFYRRAGWSAKAADVLVNLTTLQGALPQGAPTSPKLSNLVNYKLDVRLSRYAEKLGGAYTRYSDDLTFSFRRERNLHAFRKRVESILDEHGYRLQREKRPKIRRPHQPQLVTGLVVNRKVSVPREVRRLVRAMAHRRKLGKPITVKPSRLAGLEGYLRMVAAAG